jgi:glycosyltransferase involved in cell wall biosynthesis
MRIGIDARLWSESGVGRYIRNLVNGIDALENKKPKHEYVIFLRKKEYDEVEFKSESLKKVKADIRWHSVAEQLSLTKIIQKEKVDLMHFPYFSLPLSFKDPFVVTIHDLIIQSHATGKASTLPLPMYLLKQAAYRKVLNHAIFESKKIIVPTNAVMKELVHMYPVENSKVTVTYEGADPAIKSQKESVMFDHLKSIPYFLYVGNAYPHKNLETLIDGFEQFRQNYPEYHLVIAGREDFFYKRLKQDHKSFQSILFYHEVNDNDLGFLYSYAKGYVTASKAEGFGLQLVESMKIGVPIVCSNISVFRELCDHLAHYFDPEDASELAQILQKITELSANDLKILMKEEKKRASEFSWDVMVKETVSLYEKNI